jgi:catechol 2,3-dioxygenase-like lactoylglutathione lyase family enzyme
MKPRIGAIAIGVDDLEVSLKFCRDGLGLPTDGIVGTQFEHGSAVFFDLQHGVKLALFARTDIAHDAGIAPTNRSPTEFTLGHNVASEKEVDAIMHQAIAAGGRFVKHGQKTFRGECAGYLKDPDDHLWEIIFNPAFLPED